MNRVISAIGLACMIGCPPILADQLSLKNGDRLTGEIAKTDGKTLKLKTAYAGDVSVALDAIDQLSSDRPLYLTLSDGQTIVGTVASKDGRFEVSTKEAATVRVDHSSVQTIRSKAEQDAYLAEIERYRNPRVQHRAERPERAQRARGGHPFHNPGTAVARFAGLCSNSACPGLADSP